MCLYPTKSKKQSNEKQLPEKDKLSKAIDCILIKQSQKQNNFKKVIQVWIINNGVTELKQKIQKRKKFVSEFILFKDHFKDSNLKEDANLMSITYKKKQQSQNKFNYNINKQRYITEQVFIQLKYYVVGTQYRDKNAAINVKKQIMNIDSKQINLLKYPLLSQIGYIPIHNIKIQVADVQLKTDYQKRVKHILKTLIKQIQNRSLQKEKINDNQDDFSQQIL